MIRSLLLTTLISFGVFASPIVPDEVFDRRSVHTTMRVESWGIESTLKIEASTYSPAWWKRQFRLKAMNKSNPNFATSGQSVEPYLDLGDFLILKEGGELISEALISGPHNETLRYKMSDIKFIGNRAPSWWPRYFDFEGGSHIDTMHTAFGRIRNGAKLLDKLPEQGKPWLQLNENFYIGDSGLWWAFVEHATIRIIKMDKETHERQ
jgi:hypothetical protein